MWNYNPIMSAATLQTGPEWVKLVEMEDWLQTTLLQITSVHVWIQVIIVFKLKVQICLYLTIGLKKWLLIIMPEISLY